MKDRQSAPILHDKKHDAPSAYMPESLLRKAWRQKSITLETVPDICLLDPDGDIVRRLNAEGRARRLICFAHVTNQMGTIEGDFEKGDSGGTTDALQIAITAARKLMLLPSSRTHAE